MATDSATASPFPTEKPRVATDFADALSRSGLGPLLRADVTTLQINVGKLCNQACHHCHVDAGPKRAEIMPERVARRVMELLQNNPQIQTVDITGGAPELNPNFRYLVAEARRMGRHVIDRCNLTVLFEQGMDNLANFLAGNGVEITASLPCYTAENVDKQRGIGVFSKSINALHRLNQVGYGSRGSPLILNLVYNSTGPALPPSQDHLERDYKRELFSQFGIEFNNLYTLTNMPIQRFATTLERAGKYEEYMSLLVNHFNPGTVQALMCRSLLSVGWDGRLYDCDFNQMLEIGLGAGPQTIWDIHSVDQLSGRHINTGSHCFGCTAGAGSSCGGALG